MLSIWVDGYYLQYLQFLLPSIVKYFSFFCVFYIFVFFVFFFGHFGIFGVLLGNGINCNFERFCIFGPNFLLPTFWLIVLAVDFLVVATSCGPQRASPTQASL